MIGPHKLKLKKKPSLKKGVSKTHSKMDDPSLELLISDMTVHIGTYTGCTTSQSVLSDIMGYSVQ